MTEPRQASPERAEADQSSVSATAAPPKRRPTPPPPKQDRLPPYRVLLHNDDVNEMVDVVEAIVELTPLKPLRAFEVMLTAHRRGLALLLVTHKERAELYQEQFRTKRLIVSIEPAE